MDDRLTARTMDGSSLARRILDATADRASAVSVRIGRRPCLAAVLVGDDPSSLTYVRMKQKRCEAVGVDSGVTRLPKSASTADVVDAVHQLSDDDTVDGILLQHPLPEQIDARAAFEAITPAKDVDGVTMHSFAAMSFGVPGFSSCTPAGIIRLLDEYSVDPAGLHAVVIGRSPTLGLPIGMLLLARDATVTYCHSHTRELPQLVRSADIVIAAVDRPKFVRGAWLKSGAVVVDAGYTGDQGGDVDFDEARRVAGLIAPVPGGVGPMTIALLIEQTVLAAERAAP